jgi:signal transduction histidine kinase/CheY-like chemotaxis protein
MSHSPADIDLEVRQLRERVRFLEATLRHARDLVFSLDAHGRIFGVNESVLRALASTEDDLVGLPFQELLAAPVSLPALHPVPAQFKTRNGATLAVELHSDQRMVIAVNVAERHALEEGARQAQRMETLGLLAGGIAHDFNNLLTGILGYAYLLQNDPKMPGEYGEALDVIVNASERAAQLTTQLLGFARGKKAHVAPVDLHQIIKDLVELLRRTIDKKVRVNAHMLASDTYVLGEASQMYQVLLNLCLNARDAMPSGGELRITTKNAGSSIVISVADTGMGIPREIRAHIFEAFFTTKGSSRGTGMGLATVRAIVRNHGGAINVDSEDGAGATFHVTLPVSSANAVAPIAHEGRTFPHQLSANILVVEDEPFVRQVLHQMLSGLGYTVVCAMDVRSGIEYFRNHHHTIDAVILDVVMPAMSGIECLEALRDIDPKVKAVLTSGSGNGHVPGVEYLPKPYQPEQLAEVIGRVLRQAPQAITTRSIAAVNPPPTTSSASTPDPIAAKLSQDTP